MDIEDIVLYASFAFMSFALTILICFELFFRLQKIDMVKACRSLKSRFLEFTIRRSEFWFQIF